jgi:hypothetical protein
MDMLQINDFYIYFKGENKMLIIIIFITFFRYFKIYFFKNRLVK